MTDSEMLELREEVSMLEKDVSRLEEEVSRLTRKESLLTNEVLDLEQEEAILELGWSRLDMDLYSESFLLSRSKAEHEKGVMPISQ